MTTVDRIRKLPPDLTAKFPAIPKVARVEVQEGPDSTGDPSLFIWVLFPDGTPESDQTLDKVQPIEEVIVRELRAAGEPRWPYVRFRTESEYAEIFDA